ncbi:uncharacterized protein MIR9-1HG isoform X1 [Zalophus californianus]|uniref:Uncharacterized protein MIR9-1HG isoform X1 n=1 Tax=Zalophus californianus TaxID=9704 RepID=A0A6J2EKK2_ZALCA|nr:uncharacterized protein MIR9-1HG isoform X1 [Zalophus californianus]
MGSPKTSRGALLRPREKDRTRGTLGRSRICSPGWKGPGIQEAAAPLLVSSWGATLAFRTFPRAGPQRLTPGGRRSFAERGGDGGIWATELLTWGGWVFHHPPALFPPRVSQSRIQHHGQLPGDSQESGGVMTKVTQRGSGNAKMQPPELQPGPAHRV